MISEIQRLLDDYMAWLREKTTLRLVNNEWVEITTPYLDRHNDYLQIYAKSQNGSYLLSDDGYTLEDLEQSGCKIDSEKRMGLLKMTLYGFGVQLNKRVLEVHASASDFALRKHNLVQAMLAVNDLFYLASPYVASFFYEDVVAWLDLTEVRYTPKVKFTGKTGIDHLFDFVIPKSPYHPERILKTINDPDSQKAQACAFSWIDTKDVRSAESQAYALLNDSDHAILPVVIDALRSYDVHPVPWSKRDNFRQEFAN
jgi:hypothetical protein